MMLENENLDILEVTTHNRYHAEISITALEKGIHVGREA
jgi:predicted dehydrogenase